MPWQINGMGNQMRRGRIAAVVVLGIFSASGLVARAAAGLPALYTVAQARAGAAVFSQNCAMCHGAALGGEAGPPLVGQRFASAGSGETVGAMFDEIAGQMPAQAPGSLTHDQYAAVMAFILAKNGYPAGPAALDYNATLGSSVPLVSQVQ
jgi:mono/diheme cytochrome c family protein